MDPYPDQEIIELSQLSQKSRRPPRLKGGWVAFALLAVLTFYPKCIEASPCCAGPGDAAGMITGDEKAVLSLKTSQAWSIGFAPPQGQGLPVFRAENDEEWTQTLEIEGGLLLTDRLQVGLALPVRRREQQTPTQSFKVLGMGDARTSFSAELLPEYSYSRWIPRIFGSFALSLPTGTSGLGRSIWVPSLALFLVKLYPLEAGTLGLSLNLEGHRPVGAPAPDTWIESALGFSVAASTTFQTRRLPLVFSLSVSPLLDLPTRTQGAVASEGLTQLVWNVSGGAGWFIDGLTRLELRVSDQTLLGPAWNTPLERALSLRLSTGLLR
jgi:hypothetical protein